MTPRDSAKETVRDGGRPPFSRHRDRRDKDQEIGDSPSFQTEELPNIVLPRHCQQSKDNLHLRLISLVLVSIYYS